MIRRAFASLFLTASLSACGEDCPEESFEGTVTFPDGTSHVSCSPAAPLVVDFAPLCDVVTGIQSASGAAEGGEASWTVWGRYDWFARPGTVELRVEYSPAPATAGRCPPDDLANCNVTADCMFEVTRAAPGDGDVVEARLVSACTMRNYLTPNPWRPVLTSMRFRAQTSHRASADAGVCDASP